jgi:DNA-binding NarL/FixJ family response regulator
MTEHIRVMVVDDHALVRDVLAERLAAQPDIEVVATASDAGAAIHEAREHAPHIILMDIDMPGISSFDAARTIRQAAPDVGFVFLSAYVNDQYIDQALEIEALGYLSKEEPAEVVIDAVRRASRGATRFSKSVSDRIVLEPGGVSLAASGSSRLNLLTPREREILGYLAAGMPKKQIAKLLGISPKTVEKHCDHLMDKLDIHDRVKLARYAIREGLTQP